MGGPHATKGTRSGYLAWALALFVVAGIGWQVWRPGETAAPADAASPTVASPREAADAPRSPAASDEADRHDLSADERRGGHTLARHVGRTDKQLQERLDRERNISAASTYTDCPTAEQVVTAALKQNARRVDAWVARNGNRPNLAINYRGSPGTPIGRSLTRTRATSVACVDALVVLRWDGRDSYVLTSYPEVRR